MAELYRCYCFSGPAFTNKVTPRDIKIAGYSYQAKHSTQCLRSIYVHLHRNAHLQASWLASGIYSCRLPYFVCRYRSDFCHFFGRVFLNTLRQLLEAKCPFVNELLIIEIFGYYDINIPKAKAPSVPGLICSHMCALDASRDRLGSMTIRFSTLSTTSINLKPHG